MKCLPTNRKSFAFKRVKVIRGNSVSIRGQDGKNRERDAVYKAHRCGSVGVRAAPVFLSKYRDRIKLLITAGKFYAEGGDVNIPARRWRKDAHLMLR